MMVCAILRNQHSILQFAEVAMTTVYALSIATCMSTIRRSL